RPSAQAPRAKQHHVWPVRLDLTRESSILSTRRHPPSLARLPPSQSAYAHDGSSAREVNNDFAPREQDESAREQPCGCISRFACLVSGRKSSIGEFGDCVLG